MGNQTNQPGRLAYHWLFMDPETDYWCFVLLLSSQPVQFDICFQREEQIGGLGFLHCFVTAF